MTITAANARHVALSLATLLIFGLALYALSHLLREIHPADVLADLANVPWHRVLLAIACTAGSYLMLTLYDYLAVLGVGRRLPYWHVAATSFSAFGISHTAGLSSISGGSVRYRSYAVEGLSAFEVAAIVTLVAINFFLGVGTLLGLSLVIGAEGASQALPLTVDQTRITGCVLLAVVSGYLLLTHLKRTPLRIGGRVIQLPSLGLSLCQLVVACIELCFEAGTLYVLLPRSLGIAYPSFVGIFVIAIQAGVLSNVPGGLGVFESVLLLLLPGTTTDAVLGGVLLYRIIYYALPFVLALTLVTLREALHREGHLRRLAHWLSTRKPRRRNRPSSGDEDR